MANQVNFSANSREIKRGAATIQITDEIYAKLSAGNQLLVKMAESLGVEVAISQFNDTYYVSQVTIYALNDAIYGE